VCRELSTFSAPGAGTRRGQCGVASCALCKLQNKNIEPSVIKAGGFFILRSVSFFGFMISEKSIHEGKQMCFIISGQLLYVSS